MKHKKLTIKQKRIVKNILVVVLLIISFPSYTPSQVVIESDHILISNHLLSRPIECISFDGLTYTGVDGKKYSQAISQIEKFVVFLPQISRIFVGNLPQISYICTENAKKHSNK